MSTHNIYFYGEITKIIPKLSSNTLRICSTEEDILTLNGPFTTDYDQSYPSSRLSPGIYHASIFTFYCNRLR